MAVETKFVDASNAEVLTKRVQDAEKEGWEFVDVKLVAAPAHSGEKQFNFYTYALATLRRTVEQKA